MSNDVKTSFSKQSLSVAEAAAYIGISYAKMAELTRRDDFPVLCVGRKKIIPRDAFMDWFNSQRGNQHGAIAE